MAHSYGTFIFFLLLALMQTACGGRNIDYDKSHPLHGKELTFERPIVYESGVKERVVNEETRKYNNVLRWLDDGSSIGFRHFEKGFVELRYVPSRTKFKVVKSFRVIPWGYQVAFSNEYRVLVLQDERGVLSTLPEFKLDAASRRRFDDISKVDVDLLDELASQQKSCDITVRIRTPIDTHDKDIVQRLPDYRRYADFYHGKLKHYDLESRLVTFEANADFLAFILSAKFDLGIADVAEVHRDQKLPRHSKGSTRASYAGR